MATNKKCYYGTARILDANEGAGMIRFNIPAVPVAEPRKRSRVVRTGGKAFVSHYTPTKHPVNAFKASASKAAAEAIGRLGPLTGPLKIEIVFVLPRTAGQIWKTKPMPRMWHSKKPDFDNLEKSVCDALKGIVWIDDSQVCCTSVRKVIAAGDESPHVEFACEQLGEVVTVVRV